MPDNSIEADAIRYRHLRGKDVYTICQGGVFAGQTPENVVLSEEDLDEAIDLEIAVAAAISQRD
ncbi:hypothetical protein HKX54_02205 [Sulfitobacter sp. M57]|nr:MULTISPECIES: hypothetical protein [unclassified Sulfitobacter]MDF3476791.1 hypothetical protein [Sulfitobacter sp. M53]MDF3413253.1 hypothetical protein [Sulfitobacter sp. KE5]MDF3421465.1 hypothetical protein [Sulfitobacter sp. KE43]MDF3431801.1 hypothetical protein [Sulfitobacter sp. KE42]MDF3461344.1 hypothetical protein [Sulfitobacter sp. Ks18]